MNRLTIGILTFSIVLLSSCKGDDNSLQPQHQHSCDSQVIIDKDLFDNTEIDGYSIINAISKEDCLEVEISASGCDGSSWEIKLIDSGDVAESFPTQRWMKISLKNEEACEALPRRKVSFDLSPIGDTTFIINLEGWDTPLNYGF